MRQLPDRRLISSLRRTRRHFPPRGFTLIEVLVVVAIIALLISVLMPSLAQAKEQARRAVCAQQIHQSAVGLHTYAHSAKGKYPYGLSFPSPLLGGPFTGVQNPWVQFNNSPSRQVMVGYPAYIALYMQKLVPDPKVFYCPAQTEIVFGGPHTWPKPPLRMAEALKLGNLAYVDYIIGYFWYADHWMSKDGTDTKATGNFAIVNDYPDNSWAHGLGKVNGKRQVIAENTDDHLSTLLIGDIMQDYRSYKAVLGEGVNIRGAWGADSWQPKFSYNSHGKAWSFAGGNVGYNDGSVKWRTREACEADFKRSFYANNGDKTWEPRFQHMAVVKSYNVQKILNPNEPGQGDENLYNVYW